MATNSCLYDPYVALYIGNYFADTLCLTAKQHTALRLLLLALWTRQTISGFDDENAAQQLCVAIEEWQQLKASVLPLLIAVTPRVFQKIKVMRSYDGQRLPSSEALCVRSCSSGTVTSVYIAVHGAISKLTISSRSVAAGLICLKMSLLHASRAIVRRGSAPLASGGAGDGT